MKRTSLVNRTSWIVAACIAAALLATGTARSASPAESQPRFTNRLVDAQAPYLLLHAHNPVDWYPWGPEAFEKARAENKPIFLSVGYSTCFWCHVAERTLYSDPDIAALMNRWFINVKVDREQRPDVDHTYMLARQIISGSGGWPNNVFLTPELRPFFAGSYFPPERDAQGRPSFSEVLATIHEAWMMRREQVLRSADEVEAALHRIQAAGAPAAAGASLEPTSWKNAAIRSLLQRFDVLEGGFSGPRETTRFPQSPSLLLLLSEYRQTRDPAVGEALTGTLDAIAYGGIQDHLAGGFHRYSTDPGWSVPHFEKMLYDNAQLLRVYAEAHELFQAPLYRDTALRVARYLKTRMMAPGGGFYTAEDAQVNGVEGASYVWTEEQIRQILDEERTRTLLTVYALEELPHSAAARRAAGAPIPEGGGVLRVRRPVDEAVSTLGAPDIATLLRSLEDSRLALLARRDQRTPPLRDDKISIDLNGLAIDGLAIAGQVLGDASLLSMAETAAQRLWDDAFDDSTGELAHQIFNGKASGAAFLADYAHFARGLLTLHRVTGDSRWRVRARRLVDALIERFVEKDARLRVTRQASELPVQPRDHGDVASPSGTSTAIEALLVIGAGPGAQAYRDVAARLLRGQAASLSQRPEAWPALLTALIRPEASTVIQAANAAPANTASAAVDAPPALKTSRDFVSVTARTDTRTSQLQVRLKVAPGYHINANPATLDFLIPTQVVFTGVTPRSIAYPAARTFKPGFTDIVLDVYEGEAEVLVDFDAADLAALAGSSATVTVQACNDTVCLPPSKIPFRVSAAGTRE